MSDVQTFGPNLHTSPAHAKPLTPDDADYYPPSMENLRDASADDDHFDMRETP